MKTINVLEKDKLKFKRLVLDNKTKEYKLFGAMVKIMIRYKPEIKEFLK